MTPALPPEGSLARFTPADYPIAARLRNRVRGFAPVRAADKMGRWSRTRVDRAMLRQLREGRNVLWHKETEPLVTIRIATYSAGRGIGRAIDSALSQTYENCEVLVVGDGCDEMTAEAVRAYGASVRFLNLPRRGQYPSNGQHRWMVAGAAPMNLALELAAGSWLAPCDDDDVLTRDHVELLLEHAYGTEAEFVWSKAAMQITKDRWEIAGQPRLEHGQVSHGSVLYCSELRFMKHNDRAFVQEIPGDWELFDRMARAGVRMSFLDRLTYYHFANRTA